MQMSPKTIILNQTSGVIVQKSCKRRKSDKINMKFRDQNIRDFDRPPMGIKLAIVESTAYPYGKIM
jgi:hypothetical protein